MRLVEERLGAVETLLTERRGHATELAASSVGDAVFVLGGDGVVNEVVNGLPPGRPLGVIAGGHTNVFARAIGAPERSCGRADLSAGSRWGGSTGGGLRSPPGSASTRRRSASWTRSSAAATAAVRATSPMRGWSRGACSRGYEQRLELEGLGRAALVLRLERRRVHVRGAGPAPRSRPRRGSSSVSTSTAPERAGRATAMRASRPALGRPRARRAHRACSRCTTSTGSWFAATSRCRSRRTARTSAT